MRTLRLGRWLVLGMCLAVGWMATTGATTGAPVAQREAGLVLTLRDVAGRPVAGATVRVRQLLVGSAMNPETADSVSAWLKTSARTDARGQLRFDHLPLGVGLVLEHDVLPLAQFGPAQVIQVGRPLTEHTLVLPPGGELSGEVVSPDGRSLAGVAVQAQSQQGAVPGWGEAVTDAQGRYRIRQLPASRYNVFVDLGSRHDDWAVPAIEGLPVQVGQRLMGRDFRVRRGAMLAGRVVDAAGNPVADVPIGLHGPARPWSGAAVIMVRTATDGSFRLAAPPGEQVVYVAAGEGARWAGADPPMWRPTVRVGETAEHTFRLPLMR